MAEPLYRAISEPIRKGLSWNELWNGPDHGLILCWETGRQKRIDEPELADRARKGELPELAWKGGTDSQTEADTHGKTKKKGGTLQYLATWQGLRGDDLEIDVDSSILIVCGRTGVHVEFSKRLPTADGSLGE